ncbi:MAG: hypothetical protein ACRDJC_13555 [Thermomicrobiales bacterium]
MDAFRFDHLARAFAGARSRRHILAALAVGLVGQIGDDSSTLAGPGCKNVGRKCRRSKQCCSGICKGKKGNLQKRCKAHDSGGCQGGSHPSGCGGSSVSCTTSAGTPGVCATTTGNAGYCLGSGLVCTTCQKDADCRSFCGEAAACVRCPSDCAGFESVCVGPADCE